jgi:hypothetical protein
MPTSSALTAAVSAIEPYIHANDSSGIQNELLKLYKAPEAASTVARLVLSDDPVELSVLGGLVDRASGGYAASSQVLTEVKYKAQYAVQAFLRLVRAEDKPSALRNEARYHALHLAASRSRQQAAKSVDDAARKYGMVLGWHASMAGKDPRSDPQCKEAHGKNFHVDNRPTIGYPGQVHGRCRCKAGQPFARGQMI